MLVMHTMQIMQDKSFSKQKHAYICVCTSGRREDKLESRSGLGAAGTVAESCPRTTPPINKDINAAVPYRRIHHNYWTIRKSECFVTEGNRLIDQILSVCM